MQHRSIILELRMALKDNYFENPNKTYFPYDLHKERENHELVKDEIESIQINNTSIGTLWVNTQELSQYSPKIPKVQKQNGFCNHKKPL